MSEEGWLQTRELSKQFGAVVALHDLNLRIGLSEVVALVGDNGAGKSTLVKLLSGAHLPSSGEIAINGQVVTIDSPAKARSFGIATIFQELALVENLADLREHISGTRDVAPDLWSANYGPTPNA